MEQSYPQLDAPPLDEVVCGFVFKSLSAFDALDLGLFWDHVKNDYPKKRLVPLLQDGPNIQIGYPDDLRAWLVSEDDERLLQVQSDRLYINWRDRGGGYPRFSQRQGQPLSLRALALAEFERFSSFVSKHRPGLGIELLRVELTKVDKLQRGKHWKDFQDLSSFLKVANAFADVNVADPEQLTLRLVEREDGDSNILVTVALNGATVRIETRMMIGCTETAELGALLDRANRRLNKIFFGLLSKDLSRFQGGRDD